VSSRSMVTDNGAVGGLAGAGTGTRPGVQVAATLAAKFRGFENSLELAYDANLNR
jgi:hypothetical protein